MGKPDRLARAINAIIDNAVSFSPPGGLVEIAAAQSATKSASASTTKGPAFRPKRAKRSLTASIQYGPRARISAAIPASALPSPRPSSKAMTGRLTCTTAMTRHPAPASPSGFRRRTANEPDRSRRASPLGRNGPREHGRDRRPRGADHRPVRARASRTSRCACSTAASRWSATTRRSCKRDGDRLLATAPPTIAGKLEIRGIGIVEMERRQRRPGRPARRARPATSSGCPTTAASARSSGVDAAADLRSTP